MEDIFNNEYFMKQALIEAQKAYDADEVPIGAVIVCEKRIIARAHNLTERLNDVTAHAEMQAITSAADFLGGKYLDKCTIYITLEPCVMCASATMLAHLDKIVYGAGDSKKGYRYDSEGHPNSTNPNEKGPHINYWDYTKGKRNKGGKSGAISLSGLCGALFGEDSFCADVVDFFNPLSDLQDIVDFASDFNSLDEPSDGDYGSFCGKILLHRIVRIVARDIVCYSQYENSFKCNILKLNILKRNGQEKNFLNITPLTTKNYLVFRRHYLTKSFR
jgi:tRNA(adenine34) deaminase